MVLCTTSAAACNLPIAYLEDEKQFPEPVLERFCNPEEGYDSLLLMQVAIDEDTPVLRVIAVKRNDSKLVQGVGLYQYDKEGNPHPAFWRQPQAVIDFEGDPSKFEARVKGMPSTISFEDHQFEFDMGGNLGLTLKMALNVQGRISVGSASSSVLLVRTTNTDHWRWILDNGDSVSFFT